MSAASENPPSVPDGIRARKRTLRREVLAAAADIPPAERERSGRRIAARLADLPQWRSAETVSCFVGTEREIDTRPILEAALAEGKRLCVPLCLGGGVMEMRQITALSALSPGTRGIPEPGRDSRLIPAGEIALILVPCVTCDLRGNRLGYGGGYYDRFLAGYGGQTILLCRAALIRDQIPVDTHDLPALPVLTEEGVYPAADGLSR